MNDPPRTVIADRGDAARRLDLMLRRHLTDIPAATRTRIQTWIETGHVSINGEPVRRVSSRVALGDVIAVAIPRSEDGGNNHAGRRQMTAEDISVDVLYEDDWLLALNK